MLKNRVLIGLICAVMMATGLKAVDVLVKDDDSKAYAVIQEFLQCRKMLDLLLSADGRDDTGVILTNAVSLQSEIASLIVRVNSVYLYFEHNTEELNRIKELLNIADQKIFWQNALNVIEKKINYTHIMAERIKVDRRINVLLVPAVLVLHLLYAYLVSCYLCLYIAPDPIVYRKATFTFFFAFLKIAWPLFILAISLTAIIERKNSIDTPNLHKINTALQCVADKIRNHLATLAVN